MDALFDTGPLHNFQHTTVDRLMMHFWEAQSLAQAIYNRDHSNDQTGATQESIPEWVQIFSRLQSLQNDAPSRPANSSRTRVVQNSIVASLACCQAPLGYQGDGPVELRNKTSWNIGNPSIQVIGEVSQETWPANISNVKGVGNIEQR